MRSIENTTYAENVRKSLSVTPGGIRGVRCRHILYPFIKGLNTNNQKQYNSDEAFERGKVVQKQRRLEREVRKTKRSLILAEEIGDEETIQRYAK